MESAHSAYSAVERANSVFLCTLSSCTGSGYLISDVLFLTEWSHSAYSAMEPADSVFLCVLGSCTGSGFLVSAVQFLIERAHSADSAMELVDSVVVSTLSSCTGSEFLLLCGVALRKETGAIATWVVDGVLHGFACRACLCGYASDMLLR